MSLRKFIKLGTLCSAFLFASGLCAQGYNVFEVDSDTIHNTSTNDSFDSFSFNVDFENDPALFVLGATTGWNTCEVRMRNIDESGFEAVCAEDTSFDGPHAALNFQYIATAEGVQTIPTNNGGSVTFATVCKDVDEVQHNCTTGCDTESWNNFSFGHTFTNPPVILSNIQTINNGNDPEVLPGDGIEPMLSVAVGTVSTTSVDIALDLNKEDDITLSESERVCVLAVEEVSQCDDGTTDNTLDFSGVGGPSSVAFESIITGEVVDGWGTATSASNSSCNNGEQANFTSGCFTSTPVAVATKRSRNEAEGWLRYCQLNSSNLRITIDEQRDTPGDNLNRQHVDESVSVMAFGQAFTTPVSLASFESKVRKRKKLDIAWATESESFNVGFNIWGNVSGEWEQLNRKLIPAEQGAFSESKTYRTTLSLGRDKIKELESIGLSSFDSSGKEEFFGPFEIGKEYGEGASFEPIAWQQIRANYENRMQERGYIQLLNNRWVKKNRASVKRALSQQRRSAVELLTSEPGIYRVSAKQIIEQAPKFAGRKLGKIALTYNGDGVVRDIVSEDDVFDDGDFLIFEAKAADNETALYTSKLPYRVSVAPNKVQPATILEDFPNQGASVSTFGAIENRVGEDRSYLVVSKTGDPWFDAQLFTTGAPVSKAYAFDLKPASGSSVPKLEVSLSGGIALPGPGYDHHVKAYVNDHLAAEAFFRKFEPHVISTNVNLDWLRVGANTVRVEVVGDTGKAADIVHVNEVSLTVDQPLSLSGEPLAVIAEEQHQFYRIAGGSETTVVYATQANGNFARVSHVLNEHNDVIFGGISSEHLLEETRYVVLDEQHYLAPETVTPVAKDELRVSNLTDYLVVAHPAFIDANLNRFIEAKEQAGHRPELVNWLDVVESYGHGLATPQALKNYLKVINATKQIKYLLLVGGHSYDYNDYLNNGNVTFIPTNYETVSKHFRYAPTDNPYADTTADGLPNLAVGRWPVRDTEDLIKIVNKTLDWQANHASYANKTLLIADASDANTGQDFVNRIDGLTELSDIDTTHPDVAEIYINRYLEEDRETPIADAKADLLSYFDNDAPGVGLTIFNGHASSSRWTFRNLFNASDATQLQNSGQPTVVMPLACYTTYYETPTVNSLPHQLLFGTDGGAALIIGAAYLSEDRENSIFASRLLKQVKRKNLSWGQAMQRVKSNMAPWNDAVTNWTILGDPSLTLDD